MARLSKILLAVDPKGRFMEGRMFGGVNAPGTALQYSIIEDIDDDNRIPLQAYVPGADGLRPVGPYLIALEAELLGEAAFDPATGILNADTTYQLGDRVFAYIPLPGDEMNLLMFNMAGTGDVFNRGPLIATNAIGAWIPTTGTPESEPAVLLEDLGALTDFVYGWCVWSGY